MRTIKLRPSLIADLPDNYQKHFLKELNLSNIPVSDEEDFVDVDELSDVSDFVSDPRYAKPTAQPVASTSTAGYKRPHSPLKRLSPPVGGIETLADESNSDDFESLLRPAKLAKPSPSSTSGKKAEPLFRPPSRESLSPLSPTLKKNVPPSLETAIKADDPIWQASGSDNSDDFAFLDVETDAERAARLAEEQDDADRAVKEAAQQEAHATAIEHSREVTAAEEAERRRARLEVLGIATAVADGGGEEGVKEELSSDDSILGYLADNVDVEGDEDA